MRGHPLFICVGVDLPHWTDVVEEFVVVGLKGEDVAEEGVVLRVGAVGVGTFEELEAVLIEVEGFGYLFEVACAEFAEGDA